MYWWDRAAELTRDGRLLAFGLITTSSIGQVFQRRVVERHLSAKRDPLSIVFAVPDHPWVDSTDGAAVRIAMTVGSRGPRLGRLLRVVEETSGGEEIDVELAPSIGVINPNLTTGADVASAAGLQGNRGVCSPGVQLYGSGFVLNNELAAEMLAEAPSGDARRVIRPYVNGRDLMQSSRGSYVIDFFGFSADQARTLHPSAFQRVLNYVKPERDHNRRAAIREKWWRFGWERPVLRSAVADLARYIVTVETAKHRIFTFLDQETLPDNMLIVIAQDDAEVLGVLSSRLHVTWALAAGGRLGVGNDPRYNKTRCFETFPFPTPTDALSARIRALAEELDAHRKRQQAAHPGLTLTGMYNVLEKLKSGEPLTAKEREIHEQGLVSILKQLHDELDLAVLEAYGWGDLAPLMEVANGNAPPATAGVADREEARRTLDAALLERLVALNAERAAEERRGVVRWLRPDFQQPESAPAAAQDEIDLGEVAAAVVPVPRRPWPKTLTEQVKAVAETLASIPEPVTEAELAARFTARGPWRRRLANILEMLVTLGQARQEGPHYRAVGDAR
jgi:hypothetical protein